MYSIFPMKIGNDFYTDSWIFPLEKRISVIDMVIFQEKWTFLFGMGSSFFILFHGHCLDSECQHRTNQKKAASTVYTT
jgi:hypothetical protein